LVIETLVNFIIFPPKKYVNWHLLIKPEIFDGFPGQNLKNHPPLTDGLFI